jgi:hypothetical protein
MVILQVAALGLVQIKVLLRKHDHCTNIRIPRFSIN